MRTGFSLSPGGLLLPYHLGALDALQYNKFLTEESPIAGSSAGAIATACHACGIDSKQGLEATIRMSDKCEQLGSARGRLLPMLQEELDSFIQEEQVLRLQERQGKAVIAYRELFPNNRAIHQTDFRDRHDLMNAVCHSSMFPFFTTNFPVAIDTSKGGIPRVVVDGFFTVPRSRFGCPDFDLADNVPVDRTVAIAVFPKNMVGASDFADEDCISPDTDDPAVLQDLLRIATQPSSREDLTRVYESGFADAERWCRAQKTSETPIVAENMSSLN